MDKLIETEAGATNEAPRRYRLLAADGSSYESAERGLLGGNRILKIYGHLKCWSAVNALKKGYAKNRVFFADTQTAISAGYRPCGHCMLTEYRTWKRGGTLGSPEYPWLVAPPIDR
jgi:methylphosphotriester-DNA--protein-cysteine methyltransferase